jgi:tol-pal system protein YbgF
MKPMRMFVIALATALSCVVGSQAYAAQAVTPKDAEAAAKSLYARVMGEFDKGHYEAALAGFQFFIALHPRSPLASSAQYWVGDCEYRLGRYKEAIDSLSRVAHYRNSSKNAAATLKIAMAYGQLGQHDVSRILLERVLVDFPKSPEAKLAAKAIEQIRQGDQTNELLSRTVENGSQPPTAPKLPSRE